jgi:Trypsin
MRKTLFILAAALILALVSFSPAGAITGGGPDGNGHPYGALLLVPGASFCSGTLIAPTVVLTAGHCTSFFQYLSDEYDLDVWVTFDGDAAVDLSTWEPIDGQGTWYVSHTFVTHPDYVDANWPFTADYGVVILEDQVIGITPATLPDSGVVDALVGNTGQTSQRFNDVGYGQDGINLRSKPYYPNFDFVRKVSLQRYSPSKGSGGTQDPMWLMLQDVPSDKFGGGCGGDSGSGIFLADGDTVVAVHTGGYRFGFEGGICGRKTSLNHRVDLPLVLDWLEPYLLP